MTAATRVITSGSRADGMQQRLRYGLGEFRPYHYQGRPGWNPAKALLPRGKRRARSCPKCGAKAGESCLSLKGAPVKSFHTER